MRIGVLVFFVLAVFAAIAAAEEKYGVTVYDGAKYDADTSQFLASAMKVDAACYRTGAAAAQVNEFYRKQAGTTGIHTSAKGGMFKKGNITITVAHQTGSALLRGRGFIFRGGGGDEPAQLHAPLVFAGQTDTFLSHLTLAYSEFRSSSNPLLGSGATSNRGNRSWRKAICGWIREARRDGVAADLDGRDSPGNHSARFRCL
jgi:hypothetical protein